jgi:hypothetical protein
MKHLYLHSMTTGRCQLCGKPESAPAHQGIK